MARPGAEPSVIEHISLDETSPQDSGTFGFINLPSEIRIAVYELVLRDAYDSIDRNLIRRVRNLIDPAGHHPGTRTGPPTIIRGTPGVLLVCREVYHEAVHVLRGQKLRFSHGLLDFELRHLIRWDTLRNVRRIAITDDGHNVLNEKLQMSFTGIRRLFFSLAFCLKNPGHRVEYLEISFQNLQLKFHLDHCWASDRGCHMRKWTESIYHFLGHIRGIRNVKITGYVHENKKTELAQSMQSAHSPLSRLPLDVRKRILYFSRGLDTVSDAINAVNTTGVAPRLSTPSILLIDRGLTGLFLSELRKSPLVLDLRYPPDAATHHQLSSFITAMTLRSVTNLQIRMQHSAWLPLLTEIADVLSKGHSLRRLHLHYLDDRRLPKTRSSGSVTGPHSDSHVEYILYRLSRIQGVSTVSFTGDLARVVHRSWLRHVRDLMTARTSAGR